MADKKKKDEREPKEGKYPEETTLAEHQDFLSDVKDDIEDIVGSAIVDGMSPLEAIGILVEMIFSVRYGRLRAVHQAMAKMDDMRNMIDDLFEKLGAEDVD